MENLLFPIDPTPWQAAAACAGLSPSVVFARRAKEAAPALRACADCPVRRQCESAVAPAESYFDGVCAGRLWRNGRPADAARVAKAVALAPTSARSGRRG
ncbi:WhiB family transcriptional regulator [Streptomyces zaomyceticus]|uniref:WhiB family transcriptional regulator n=1 Tax=Streptomyces zaomyceticus TaxID=68286 RepID=UPI0036BAAEFE